ncbi:hypothetical protein [Streptomyces sp. CS090A]|uniref:hypothetical protein n=1 Tax=Streptomyces sp. CS090A TaxID=2162710 RepID=UPI001EF3E407|nr:hypothetical protein [Streptomyces sp. CS090A]
MNEVTIRHDLSPGPDADQFAERLSEPVARRIDKIEGSAAAAVETWESTVNSMQLGSAIFALLGSAEGAGSQMNHFKISWGEAR